MAESRIRVLAPEDSVVRWKSGKSYTASQQVLAPTGEVVVANDNHTSSSTYAADAAAHWTPVLVTIYGPGGPGGIVDGGNASSTGSGTNFDGGTAAGN